MLHPITAGSDGPLGAVAIPPNTRWALAAVFTSRKPLFRMTVVLEQQPQQQHPAHLRGIPVQPVEQPLRHLGVPLSGSLPLQELQRTAFATKVGGMRATLIPWRAQGLNLIGRVHVAKQCAQSRAIFALGYFGPSAAAQRDMEDVVAAFVGRSERRDEVAPWQLRGLVHPQVTGWRHLRDVWQTLCM
jgi:hypothetical protein